MEENIPFENWSCVVSEDKYQIADENGTLAWNGTIHQDKWFLDEETIVSLGLGDALELLAPEAVRV